MHPIDEPFAAFAADPPSWSFGDGPIRKFTNRSIRPLTIERTRARMKVQFIASSLEDIADHFDGLASAAQDRLLGNVTAKGTTRLEKEIEVWKEAAQFLREVKLVPEENEE
jgi:hypothetical protein